MGRADAVARGIARRYKTLRGVRAGGLVFLAAAAVELAASAASHWSAARPGLAVSLGVVLGALCAAFVGFLLGRRRAVDLPRLLLQVDLALGTGERLSSLHELRARGASPVLQRRIEERLEQEPPAWRRAVRPGRGDLVPWLAGCAVLAASLVLLSAAKVPPEAAVVPPLLPARAATGNDVTPTADESPYSASVTETSGSAEDVAARPREDVAEPLVDVLAELLPTPPSRGLLGPTEGAIQDDRRASGSSSQGLSNLLAQVAGRNQGDAPREPRLTEQEREELRDLAERLPDSPLRDALLAILAATSDDAVAGEAAKALSLLHGDAPGDRSPLAAVSGLPDDGLPPGVDKPQATSAGGAESPAGENSREAGEVTDKAASDKSEAGGGAEPSADARGGKSTGSEGEGSASPGAPGLVPEELLSEWSESGDVRRFLTKGLPFESPSAEPGTPMTVALDAEALRTLLETRALAAELQDLIRAYFKTITQGDER